MEKNIYEYRVKSIHIISCENIFIRNGALLSIEVSESVAAFLSIQSNHLTRTGMKPAPQLLFEAPKHYRVWLYQLYINVNLFKKQVNYDYKLLYIPYFLD